MGTRAKKIIIITLVSLTASAKASELPTASELLTKYVQALDSVPSFIVKAETTSEHDWRFSKSWPEPGYRGKGHKGTSYERMEIRTDGQRLHERTYQWGQMSNSFPSLSKEQPMYTCRNYTNAELYRHSMQMIPSSPGGLVMLSKPQESYMLGGIDQRLQGYVVQSNERVDLILSRAENISVRPETERGGSSDCYVIDAETDCGRISVWIDPEHGYHLAKAEARGTRGNLYFGKPLTGGQVISNRIEVLRFEEIDGIWVPMEVSLNMENHYGPDSYSMKKEHYKRTEVVVNPDHDALGSFDDPIKNPENDPLLKNGTMVKRVGVPIRFTWQDGELIPNIDKTIVDQLDTMADEVMNEAIQTGPAIMTSSQLLKRYSEAQDKCKSFIAKADSSIESSGTSKINETEQCEFRTDGSRVNHRSFIWDNQSSKDKASYKSFLWDGQSLTQYNKGLVFISKNDISKKRVISTEYKGSPLLGICADDYDRIDSILRKAGDATVRQLTEKVGDSQCYLIEATNKLGSYKVWIDPQHGYNIAKIEIERKGDAGAASLFTLKNVRFERIDDIWVPMEADMEQTEGSEAVKWHHKRTKILLNPDHKTLRSFVSDDIPNGTKANILGQLGIEYTWENGRLVKEVKSNAIR